MPDCIFAIDAGGTFFKYMLLDEGCQPIAGTAASVDAHSGDDAAVIHDAYLCLCRHALSTAGACGLNIARIAVSTPGPYNYAGGFSMMPHKFKAIRGVSVIPWFHEVLPGRPISFMSDANAFLLGEALSGAAREAVSPIGITLGTGFGFASMKERRLMVGESLIPYGALWNRPFRDGIVEDYVSRRAIRARYQTLKRCSDLPDVREIADQARQGDAEALETFRQTGRFLGEILTAPVREYGADLVVVGGQIARSQDLFLNEARALLDCPIVSAAHIDDAALRGAAQYGLLGTARTMTVLQ